MHLGPAQGSGGGPDHGPRRTPGRPRSAARHARASAAEDGQLGYLPPDGRQRRRDTGATLGEHPPDRRAPGGGRRERPPQASGRPRMLGGYWEQIIEARRLGRRLGDVWRRGSKEVLLEITPRGLVRAVGRLFKRVGHL